MSKLRRIFTYLFLVIVAVSGLMVGCGDKYKNLKVTCDNENEGITLYVGEEDSNTADLVFNVLGAGDNISTELKFSFTQNEETKIVEFVGDAETDGASTKVKIRALHGGSTTLVALTEEGSKSCSVKINCIVRANSMSLNSEYSGYIVAGGNSLVLDTSKIVKFNPSDTTQNHIAYKLSQNYQGVSLTESGLLTVDKSATVSSVSISVVNLDNSMVTGFDFNVDVIKYISTDAIQVTSEKGETVDSIELSTNRDAETQKTIYVNVLTDEDYTVSFKLVRLSETDSAIVNCAEITSVDGSEATILALDSGNCKLKITISVKGLEVQSVYLPVNVVELPTSVSVNDNTSNFEQTIYTRYNNNIGEEYVVNVGSDFANDKRFILVASEKDADNLVVSRSDGSTISVGTINDTDIDDNYEILQNGTRFFVRGLNANEVSVLKVIAYGSLNHDSPTIVEITFTTLLGVETITPVYVNEEISAKTIFVEEGKTTTISYTTDNENASTKGLSLQTVDTSLGGVYFTSNIANVENPVVTITGTKEGSVSVRFVLPNMVTSEVFIVKVFKTINTVLASVESPLASKNIAEANYSNNQLTSFVMSLGVGTQLSFTQIAQDGTLLDLTCTAKSDGNENIISISTSGYVVSRSVGSATIVVTAQTLQTQDDKVQIKTITFEIGVTVYVPIRSISLDKSNLELYYQEELNWYLFNDNKFTDSLNLNIYPNSVNLSDENLKIYWVSSDESHLQIADGTNSLSKNIIATTGDDNVESSTAYIEVFVSYYGTTFSKRCVVSLIKAVRAQGVIVTVDGKTEDDIYFDGRNNLSIFNGTINANGVTPIKIGTKVYPSQTTDQKVIYDSYDKSVIYVDENGNVYPLSVGSTYIRVYAEDSISQLGDFILEPQYISVVVADGKTYQTALKLASESDFNSIQTDLHYFFASNIYLTNPVSCFGDFSGSISGRGYNLFNLQFANGTQSLFNEITGEISNLSITASVDVKTTQSSSIALLAQTNSGTLTNVNVILSNFNVENASADADLNLAGIVITNNGKISGCTVDGSIVVTGTDCQNLNVGMLVATNNGTMLGSSNNYQYGSQDYITFSANGQILVEISAQNGTVGGIVGINTATIGSNNSGSTLGKGFATEVEISAPKIQYVGGIAGQSSGTISNALVYANIVGGEYVGGIAGQSTGKIETSIVELYCDPYNQDIAYGIAGSSVVGGLVGQVSGNADVASSVANSYIYSYSSNSFVSGATVGGIAGEANSTTISISSAYVNLDGTTVGGLVGIANGVTVENCYSRANVVKSTASGKFVGKLAGTLSVNCSYSTIADENIKSTSTSMFVGREYNYTFTITNSYHLSTGTDDIDETALYEDTKNGYIKTETELKTMSTYSGWSIGTTLVKSNSWYINANQNDGYPVLIYNGYAQNKKLPTTLTVNVADDYKNNVSDGILILKTSDYGYSLSNLFNVSTDSDSSTRILVTATDNSLLSSNTFDKNTKILSSSECFVTLEFMLYANPSVKQEVNILFTNGISSFEFGNTNINLKVGTSEKINAFIYGTDGSLVNAGDLYFGADISSGYYINDKDTYFSISNSTTKGNMLYFQAGATITANTSNNGQSNNFSISLYKKVEINGETRFVKILSGDKSVSIKIVVTNGATGVAVDKKQIELTVMNKIKFVVTVNTDNEYEVLQVTENSSTDKIYIATSNNNNDVEFATGTGSEDYILQLTALESKYDAGTKTFEFEISFLDKYLSGTDFASKISTSLKFVAENYDATMEITATPQNVLKIDMIHYPAGRQTLSNDKTVYNPTEIPSNTLTPGQVGLLAIDMYPTYAYFDEIQLTSSVVDGNYISFVQTALYDTLTTTTASRTFVELKPNPEIVENGIILSKQSYISSSDGTTQYDGTLYVKTLIGSNVARQTTFTVTVSSIVYVRDSLGNIVYENGKPQKTTTNSKTISIVVAPNPDLKIEVEEDDNYKGVFGVYDKTTNKYSYTEYEHLIARGTSANVDVTVKNYSSKFELLVSYDGKYSGKIIQKSTQITSEMWTCSLYVDASVPAGTIITVKARATKTINGINESYESETITFCVVDYILLGVEFEKSPSSLLLSNGETQGISTKLVVKSGADDIDVEALQTTLNTTLGIWYPNKTTQEGTSTSWKNEGNYDYYEIKQSGDNAIQITAIGVGVKDFSIKFDYYYCADGIKIPTDNPDIISNYEGDFTLEVISSTSLDNPLPIYTIKQFLSMTADNDYILMEDLEFGASTDADDTKTTSAYTAMELTAKSFDGNCKTITINSFNYAGTETEKLGLFTYVGEDVVVKNVYVKYNLVGDLGVKDKTSAIIFGGLVAQNEGVITNSVVTYNPVSVSNGDITETSNTLNFLGTSNQIGAFVGINDGIITYSTAQGLTALTEDKNGLTVNSQNNFFLESNGSIAGFVCENSNLISNCQTKYIGLKNTTSSYGSSMTAGFVCTNSGNIYYSSVTGQLIDVSESLTKSSVFASDISTVKALGNNDSRLTENYEFARLESNGNIAGFVYINSGNIKDAFSNIPMHTQARSAGFAFQINSSATISSVYTVSYYDGNDGDTLNDNTAHTAFVGTNELGEVLNDSSNISYSYYISDTSYIELDSEFKQPATHIKIDDAEGYGNYVGFDLDNNDKSAIWYFGSNAYKLPILQANTFNDSISGNFEREQISSSDKTETAVNHYSYKKTAGAEDCPYIVATAQQLLNIKEFNATTNTDGSVIYIRLINNLSFASIDQTELSKLQNYNFVGGFDGNGMTISDLRVSGLTSNSSTNSSTFGLFGQIGTFDKDEGDVNSYIRNLTVKVDEFAKSDSAFVGILSGIIVNTSLKNVTIDSEQITVLGKNIVGGVAGAILGDSTLFNVSSNVSVEAAYLNYESEDYQTSDVPNKFSLPDELSVENLIATSSTTSYAGGIAGVVAINKSLRERNNDNDDDSNNDVPYNEVSQRTSNINLAKVSGNITITAERVGGLFGYAGEDVFIMNSQFVVSSSDTQRFNAFYSAGGLIGENYGVIYLSKVEVDAQYVDQFDAALTNQTGTNLFNGKSATPVYIGGLVGENYGGYISSSYSKTNVISSNASYAGGIIGYATNNGQTGEKNYRETALNEVYSTGNVFAGAEYSLTGDKSTQTATPTTLAGGIFGLYEISTSDSCYDSDISTFNLGNVLKGVEGLNGFYKPSTFSTTFSYGDVANGHTYSQKNSDKTTTEITYGATVGAFAGKIVVSGDISELNLNFEAPINSTSSNKYVNMFTTFAYNNSNITSSDCANAKGSVIPLVAKALNGSNEIGITSESYNTYVVTSSNQTITIGEVAGTNSVETSDINTSYTIAPNNAYLLFRSENVSGKFKSGNTTKNITYADFVQNTTGIYQQWNITTWSFEDTVYPKIIEGDTNVYIEISNEKELRSISNNYKNYILVADIYLSDYWDQISTFGGHFISQRRSDGTKGINGSDYYCIYNININDATTTGNVGFFQSIQNAEISNINFVFGTTLDDPNGKDTWNPTLKEGQEDNVRGISINQKSGNSSVGSIAGVATSSTISDCNVYYITSQTSAENKTTSQNAQIKTVGTSYGNLSVGGIVGTSDKSSIPSTLQSGSVTQTIKTSSVESGSEEQTSDSDGIETQTISASTATVTFTPEESEVININASASSGNLTLSVGSIIGEISDIGSTGISITSVGADITVNASGYDTVNVGGFVGKASGVTSQIGINVSSSKETVQTRSVSSSTKIGQKIDVSGSSTECNLGGVIGYADNIAIGTLNSTTTLNSPITVNSSITANELNVGGLVGSAKGNAVAINALTLNSATLNISSTVKDNDGEMGNLRVGGFIGYAGSQVTATSCQLDSLAINGSTFNSSTREVDKSASVANNSDLGGFVGYSNSQLSYTNCYVIGADIDVQYANLGSNVHTGGFVGRGSGVLSNCYASGNITTSKKTTTSNAETQCYAGFAGLFENINSDSKLTVSNCVADVDIEISATSEELKVSGFANVDDSTDETTETYKTLPIITTCISLGDIHYAGVYTGTAAGFVDNVTERAFKCYSLSTLKLISEDNSKISADYIEKGRDVTNSDLIIYFNYNLSGSINYKGLASKDSSKQQTYSALAKKALDLLKDCVSKDISDEKYSVLGSKLNPIKLTSSSNLTEILSSQEAENKYYYYIDSDYITFNTTSNEIAINSNTNIIGNDSSKVYGISSKNNLTLNNSGFISGVCFNVASSSVACIEFNQNSGYVFNTTFAGTSTDASKDHAGFVITNTGIINASGTIAQIQGAADKSSASGFVYDNSGLIANSFANGIIQDATTLGNNNGFADSNTGAIVNSYSSTTIFDVTISSDFSTNEHFSNAFVRKQSGKISSCYYNDSKNKSDTTIPKDKAVSLSYEDLTVLKWLKQTSLLTGFTENDDWLVNYGYPYSVTYTIDTSFNSNFVIYSTYKQTSSASEDDTSSDITTASSTKANSKTVSSVKYAQSGGGAVDRTWLTAYIKSPSQMAYLMNYVNTNKSEKNYSVSFILLTNIDMTLMGSVTGMDIYKYDGSKISIMPYSDSCSYSDIHPYVIYGITLESDGNDGYGFASARTVNISNVGIVGTFSGNGISAYKPSGLFIGYANSATIENSYATLSYPLTVYTNTNENTDFNSYFGIFAGSIESATITNSFASGDLTVQIMKLGKDATAYIGGFAGYVSAASLYASSLTSEISNVFSTGTITIIDSGDYPKQPEVYVGGLFGYLSCTGFSSDTASEFSDVNNQLAINNCYSVMEIVDKSQSTNVTCGAVIGSYYAGGIYQYLAFTLESSSTSTEYYNLGETPYKIKDNMYGTGTIFSAIMFDPGVSLVEYAVGYYSSTKESYLTIGDGFTYGIIFSANSGKFYDNHYPIADKVNTSVVQQLLDFNDNEDNEDNKQTGTGSRFSPIYVATPSDIFDKESDTHKFYYIDSSLDLSKSIDVSNITLYGCGQTSDVETGTATLFNKIEKSTITGLTVTLQSSSYKFASSITNSTICGITLNAGALASTADSSTIIACTTPNSYRYGLVGETTGTTGTTYILNCSLSEIALVYDSGVGGLVLKNSGTLTIKGVTIGNITTAKASDVGGLVYSNDGTLNIVSSTVKNISGKSEDSTPKNVGGLLYVNTQTATATITNCTFTGSITATGNVGGLLCGNSGTLTITDCTFNGTISTSGAVGGIMYNNAAGSTATITNCSFTGSIKATGDVGGLVYSNDGTLNIVSSTVKNISGASDDSTSITATGNVGGILCQNSGTATISNPTVNLTVSSKIEDNAVYIGGIVAKDGDIFAEYSGTITVNSPTIEYLDVKIGADTEKDNAIAYIGGIAATWDGYIKIDGTVAIGTIAVNDKYTPTNKLNTVYMGLLFGTVQGLGYFNNGYISITNDKDETIEYNAVNISTYNNSSSINFGVYNVTTAYMGTFGMIENTLLDLVIDLQFLKEIANVHLNWGKISYDNLYYGGIVGKINKVEDVYKKHLQISNAPATSTTLDMTKCDDDWKYSINISLYGALHYYYFPHLGGISTSTAYSDYFPDYSNESKITSTITVYTDREKSDREKTLSIYFSGDETTKGITWKKASEYTS